LIYLGLLVFDVFLISCHSDFYGNDKQMSHSDFYVTYKTKSIILSSRTWYGIQWKCLITLSPVDRTSILQSSLEQAF